MFTFCSSILKDYHEKCISFTNLFPIYMYPKLPVFHLFMCFWVWFLTFIYPYIYLHLQIWAEASCRKKRQRCYWTLMNSSWHKWKPNQFTRSLHSCTAIVMIFTFKNHCVICTGKLCNMLLHFGWAPNSRRCSDCIQHEILSSSHAVLIN